MLAVFTRLLRCQLHCYCCRCAVTLTCFDELLCFLPSGIPASATTARCIDGCFNSRVGAGLVLLQTDGVGPDAGSLQRITARQKHDTQALMCVGMHGRTYGVSWEQRLHEHAMHLLAQSWC
jgi:hypothetical protein